MTTATSTTKTKTMILIALDSTNLYIYRLEWNWSVYVNSFNFIKITILKLELNCTCCWFCSALKTFHCLYCCSYSFLHNTSNIHVFMNSRVTILSRRATRRHNKDIILIKFKGIALSRRRHTHIRVYPLKHFSLFSLFTLPNQQ